MMEIMHDNYGGNSKNVNMPTRKKLSPLLPPPPLPPNTGVKSAMLNA